MIVFCGYQPTRDRYVQLYRMADDGQNLFRLTDNTSASACLHLHSSPDGSQLLFEVLGHGVYRINADGTQLSRLPGTDAEDYPLSWLPDGRIVLGHRRLAPDWAIDVLASDGTQRQRLFAVQPYRHVALAPDLQTVAFVDPTTYHAEAAAALYRPGAGEIIYRARTDGTQRVVLVQDQRPKYGLQWSPNGGHLAFLAAGLGDHDHYYDSLYVIDADGANLRRLGDVVPPEQGVVWSPDSRALAWPGYRLSDGHILCRALYVTDVQGTQTSHVTDLNEADAAFERNIVLPAWAPDGQSLLVSTYRQGSMQLDRVERTGQRRQTLVGVDYPFERLSDLTWRV